jgi:hypothetical protein
MAEKALLTFGLSRDEAAVSTQVLSQKLGLDINLISASGMEDRTVEEILELSPDSVFVEDTIRFVMFLGFDDKEIRESLTSFPLTTQRPIFCTLTENNLSWTIRKLADHLLEEHRAVRGDKG